MTLSSEIAMVLPIEASLKPHHPVSVWKFFRGQMRQPGDLVVHSLQEKDFPIRAMVRESENNVEHLSSRGASRGIFINRHSTFDIGRVPYLTSQHSKQILTMQQFTTLASSLPPLSNYVIFEQPLISIFSKVPSILLSH